MKTISKTTQQKDLKRGEELMTTLSQVLRNKEALMATIKNELDAYTKNAKEAEKELLEIGERNKDAFNADGNLVFDDGYIHTTNSTVVVTSKKFDVGIFHDAHPELMKVELKTGEVKKAFLDKALRKELISLGVQVDNEQSLKVITQTLQKGGVD
jgi:tRNA-binding EMAP/Myf-like protein